MNKTSFNTIMDCARYIRIKHGRPDWDGKYYLNCPTSFWNRLLYEEAAKYGSDTPDKTTGDIVNGMCIYGFICNIDDSKYSVRISTDKEGKYIIHEIEQ